MAYSQSSEERVEAALIAHLTKELNLSSAEAKEFWPVFNEFQEKRKQIKDQQRSLFDERKSAELDDKRSDQILNSYFQLERKEDELNEEYYGNKLSRILGSKRVITLMIAEKQFRKMLLDRLKDRRGSVGRSRPKN
jgi:hypothetical protein